MRVALHFGAHLDEQLGARAEVLNLPPYFKLLPVHRGLQVHICAPISPDTKNFLNTVAAKQCRTARSKITEAISEFGSYKLPLDFSPFRLCDF